MEHLTLTFRLGVSTNTFGICTSIRSGNGSSISSSRSSNRNRSSGYSKSSNVTNSRICLLKRRMVIEEMDAIIIMTIKMIMMIVFYFCTWDGVKSGEK